MSYAVLRFMVTLLRGYNLFHLVLCGTRCMNNLGRHACEERHVKQFYGEQASYHPKCDSQGLVRDIYVLPVRFR